MPRLNVMHLIDVTGRGGAEKALVDLARGLDRRRYAVSVCATRSAGNYQPLLDAAGIPSLILDRQSRRDLYKLGGLVQVLRRQPIHILHAHLFGSNTWARLLGTLAGVPVIIAHEHGSAKAAHEIWLDRLLYRLGDAVVVPSAASKRLLMQLEGLPAHALSVVYNGVDTAQFAGHAVTPAIRRTLGLDPTALLIGSVGRLSADKGGQDVLIRAVAQLRQTQPQVGLVFIGDGPLRPSLTGLAAQLGQTAAVQFTGVRPDVAQLLGALDLFVLPSLHEALPIAVLEALAVGLPVVTTRVGGVPEVVQDGVTGVLVPPGDAAALAAALARLIADPAGAARLAAAGQARVRADFTLDAMIAQVDQLYRRLARRKSRRRASDDRRATPAAP
ncbi:MAG: glycosyltransferase [Chloroflexota bacterium]|nr:glycosyltransferase [Chloroflexota bacterium]